MWFFSSCSGGLRPLVELCVEPAGLCGRCTADDGGQAERAVRGYVHHPWGVLHATDSGLGGTRRGRGSWVWGQSIPGNRPKPPVSWAPGPDEGNGSREEDYHWL